MEFMRPCRGAELWDDCEPVGAPAGAGFPPATFMRPSRAGVDGGNVWTAWVSGRVIGSREFQWDNTRPQDGDVTYALRAKHRRSRRRLLCRFRCGRSRLQNDHWSSVQTLGDVREPAGNCCQSEMSRRDK